MREKVKDELRLQHILDAIRVLEQGKQDYNLSEIEANPILLFGFVKHVEIIGEAVYMLSHEFKTQHAEVEWEVIEKMRHVLVHGYYQIRPRQLWDTIDKDIPLLKPRIEAFLKEERERNAFT